jgi:DUF971 family protein
MPGHDQQHDGSTCKNSGQMTRIGKGPLPGGYEVKRYSGESGGDSEGEFFFHRNTLLALRQGERGFSAILKTMPSADPKSVKVQLQAGTGVEIEWKDGHLSRYSFPFLRDACPCALCDEERGKAGRDPGDPVLAKPGELVMFKAAAKPLSAEPVGKYALKFKWNDGHELGIYSWQFLRDVCPCGECRAAKATG